MSSEGGLIPQKSGWWWIRVSGIPTIIHVMYQCQELWPEDKPWREVSIGWPWADGRVELGFMDKATGVVLGHSGQEYHKSLEWVCPVEGEVPCPVYHPDAIKGLAESSSG